MFSGKRKDNFNYQQPCFLKSTRKQPAPVSSVPLAKADVDEPVTEAVPDELVTKANPGEPLSEDNADELSSEPEVI